MALDYWTGPLVVTDEAWAEDTRRLAEIHAAAFPGAAWSAEDLSALLREEPVFGLVARRANVFGTRAPVGFVLARAVAGEAEILTVAVDPAHRRRGVARGLMEQVLRRLYRERIEAVFLEVDAGNVAAVALYRRLAFAKVGERRGYYAQGSVPGATALVMRADLR
ncbi:GNAT family N-acetyltransferase [Siculibacillus lacustris]|uniref:GNAT family N-acetyltransferase n=1 Tax=Siculibacillus lacustris TaxID=1549641 RepID=A0A4V2KTA9_9HYPH|nr:GNAT family N-acetyltransferase [Siculibacillus lacustris]TBW36476.1 GNAT family N-acetyltransferase [Siculibacillus lacustris]